MREDLANQAALEAYGAVRHEGRLADRALEFTLRAKRNLYSNERRAVAERVYGLLRRQRLVDFALERAHPSFGALSATQQDLLRLSAARCLGGESPQGVGRSARLSGADAEALSSLSSLDAWLGELDEVTAFAVRASVPDFLARRFLDELGDEAAALMRAQNERAPLVARVNTLKGSREALRERLAQEGVVAHPTPLSPLGLVLDAHQNAFSLASFKEGWFELQDEGSQLLGMLVDPPPTRVVDACAGAGGKTLQLAAEMKNRGELFALDVDERRLDELRRRARRAGVHNVRVRPVAKGPEAAEALGDLEGRADRVLVDAPCSGTGTFRRNPDARYRLTEADLAAHVERQRALLARFSPLVKPGGALVYGTCSVLREENEAVVEAFLSAHPSFSVLPVTARLGGQVGAQVERDGFLRLYPHRHGTDGFFGAVLVRAR